MVNKEIGHHFLARLGKKRLRPGGVTATNWLIEQGLFSKNTRVLEVACNMCTTSIELAQRFSCSIVGIDMDTKVLDKARENIRQAKLEHLIQMQQGNALKLPFEDHSFDIVINEAMLTMLHGKAKEQALKEYLRVLKTGGRLLTHDAAYQADHLETILNQLSQTIHVHVQPLHVEKWQKFFQDSGFSKITTQVGPMTLLSLSGLIKDEGLLGSAKVLWNGLKKENRIQFLNMYRFLTKLEKICGISPSAL